MAFDITSGTSADASSTTVVITAPSSIAVGDYLTAHLTFGKSGGEPTVTPASGFTELKKESGETASVHAVYGKVADSGDAAAGTFTFTLSSSQNNRGGMLRIRGQKTSGAFDVTNSISSNSNSTTITISSVTPTNIGSLFILSGGIVGSAENFSGYAMATDNPTWTEQVDVVDNPCLFIATAVRSESSATGNITITQSISDHAAAIVIVINAEPASVTVSPTVISVTATVQSPTITGSALVSTTVMSVTVNVQSPTVTLTAPKWVNNDKTTAGAITNEDKNAINVTNESKSSAGTITNQTKS
jgi:hypothetical protein